MSEYILVHGIRVAKDFTPETFGRLTTLGPAFKLPYGSQVQHKAWQVCRCNCGNVFIVVRSSLKNGQTKSCGCFQKEWIGNNRRTHGLSTTPEYSIWRDIKSRCLSSKNVAFPDYGGRGITVCDRWLDPKNGLQNFILDMGKRPATSLSIDRHPNKDGNYEPGNCRWATTTEQSRNKRNNVNLTHDGKTQCLSDWAKELGVKRNTLDYRLRKGWSVQEVLSTSTRKPNDKRPKHKQTQGKLL